MSWVTRAKVVPIRDTLFYREGKASAMQFAYEYALDCGDILHTETRMYNEGDTVSCPYCDEDFEQ